jgi:hypothetical protein
MSSLPRNSLDFLGEVRDGLKAAPQQVMKGPTPIIEDDSEDFFVVHEPAVTIEEGTEPRDFAPESRQWQALVNTSLW